MLNRSFNHDISAFPQLQASEHDLGLCLGIGLEGLSESIYIYIYVSIKDMDIMSECLRTQWSLAESCSTGHCT